MPKAAYNLHTFHPCLDIWKWASNQDPKSLKSSHITWGACYSYGNIFLCSGFNVSSCVLLKHGYISFRHAPRFLYLWSHRGGIGVFHLHLRQGVYTQLRSFCFGMGYLSGHGGQMPHYWSQSCSFVFSLCELNIPCNACVSSTLIGDPNPWNGLTSWNDCSWWQISLCNLLSYKQWDFSTEGGNRFNGTCGSGTPGFQTQKNCKVMNYSVFNHLVLA